MELNNNKKIILIKDADNSCNFGYFDVTNMSGPLLEYYAKDPDNFFDSYEEYRDDMIKRGAVPISVEEQEKLVNQEK